MSVTVAYRTKLDYDGDGWDKSIRDIYCYHAKIMYAHVKIALGDDMARAASNMMKDQILTIFADQLSGHKLFKKITKNQLGFHHHKGSIVIMVNIANLDYYSDQHFSKKTKMRLGQITHILADAGQVCSDFIPATLFTPCF